MMDDVTGGETHYTRLFPPPRLSLPLFPIRVVYGLIIINGLFFAIDYLTERSIFTFGAVVPELVLYYNQWWRLVTAGFVHADLIHIGANLYALYGLGTLVERFFGPYRTSGIYLMSLFGANALVTLLSSWSTPTVGASGAIMGVLGAALTYFWRYRNLLTQGRRYLAELVKMAVINVSIGLLPGISLWGHLGGLLVGLVMGWIFLPHYRLEGVEIKVLKIQPMKPQAWIYSLAVIVIQMGIVALAYGWRM